MIDAGEQPLPRPSAAAFPGKSERLAQGIHGAHGILCRGASAPGETHRGACSRRVIFHHAFVGTLLDREEKKLPKNFARSTHDEAFVVSPAIRVVIGKKTFHLPPISPLDGLQKMLLMQPYLPFRLPEPGRKEREHDETARDG